MDKITKASLLMSSLLLIILIIMYVFISGSSMISFTGFMLLPIYTFIGMVLAGMGVSRGKNKNYKILNLMSFLLFAFCFVFFLYIYFQLNIV
ncbi:hypothetical protein [Virgibacillus halodenitrificans]|uniref:DUF3953 domain-containing protein n=1 Tax=Virgibacillus halodenitrificans TaxID=1482 RepID=A0ABR7VIZ1_VIRHA|nr:hypothetical protein [Virgibacillus halodenitrificans]MBD1221895.1 hypothetical protein [Virgibacillus halodenitrificans]